MKGVVLAAGQGLRLRPLTDNKPKCLVEVHGKPILDRALSGLIQAGVEEIFIGVGYQAKSIENRYGNLFEGTPVQYIDNPDYATTNNIYSFWLMRDALMGNDMLLMEGDILFDSGLLTDLAAHPDPDVMVADRFQDFMDGTVVLTRGRHITNLVLKADQGPEFDYSNAFKTVNINKFSGKSTETYFAEVDRWIYNKHIDTYYEAALGPLIQRRDMKITAMPIGQYRWAETDDIKDLRLAEKIFSDWVE